MLFLSLEVPGIRRGRAAPSGLPTAPILVGNSLKVPNVVKRATSDPRADRQEEEVFLLPRQSEVSSETDVFHTTTNDATEGFGLDVVSAGPSVRQDEETANSLLRTPLPKEASVREERAGRRTPSLLSTQCTTPTSNQMTQTAVEGTARPSDRSGYPIDAEGASVGTMVYTFT